jgi:nucleotide-binding universal stress UspA family protein
VIRSIVCPVDFSDQSRDALRWAAGLAARHRSRLIVMTAVDPLLANAARARLGMDLEKAETEPALRDFVKGALSGKPAWAPDTALDVRVGEAADAILESAEKTRADLLVMGTHGLGGVRKLLLGSTTDRVLRRTTVALLAVPFREAAAVVVDAGGPRFDLKRILLATDFSAGSEAALRQATDFAQHFGVPLVLAHVVTAVVVPIEWQPYVAEADAERSRQARERLEELVRTLPRNVECEVVVAVGRPADMIASIAEEREAGLIVVGQQGARATRPGSTAYRVLALAHVPVLVVPPPDGRRSA